MKNISGVYAEEVNQTPNSYTGGETLTPNGSSTACTLPSGTNFVVIAAESGDIYYAINPGANAASASSAGYIANGTHWVIGPLASLTSLKVYAAAGSAKAHCEYYTA
jgi:hypothetical protein